MKHFIEILKEHRIDIHKEYNTLFELIFSEKKSYLGKNSFYSEINDNFCNIWFRGTAISLEDFELKHNIDLSVYSNNITLDEFILFCEVWYNISLAAMGSFTMIFHSVQPSFIIEQINRIIKELNFKSIENERITVFVPMNKEAIEVSEIVNENEFETLFYNHYSLRGNIEKKRELLLKFANYLEPKRKELKAINSKLESEIFQLFNKLNIRHNNVDKDNKIYYVKYVEQMDINELEKWYDQVYQMYLLAILEIEHLNRKDELSVLINNINNK